MGTHFGGRSGSRGSALRLVIATLAVETLLLCAPERGLAQRIGDASALRVMGRATAREVSVAVVCEPHGSVHAVRCTVTVGAVIWADEDGVRLCAEPCDGSTLPYPNLLVGGEPLRGTRSLASGEQASLRIVTERELTVERGWEGVLSQPPLGLRHPLFGESWLSFQSPQTARVEVISGSELTVQGRVAVDLPSTPHVRVTVNGHGVSPGDPSAPSGIPRVDVQLRGPHGAPPEGPLAHGGPVVTLGARLEMPNGSGRFLLGLGYELGLVDYLVVSAWVETDFEDHLSEALLVEAAAPGYLFIVPSVSAGIGLVARQLGLHGSDAGARIRLGATFFAAGFVADFDYWAVTGTWTATLVARVSL